MGSKATATVEFTSYDESVSRALDEIGAGEALERQRAVLVKPNLVNDSPPPVTTPAECCAAVIGYVRRCSKTEIVIAEGCGASGYETGHVFEKLGYSALSERLGVPLVDLNTAPTRRLEDATCTVFGEFHMPEIAFSHYIISVPVLKAHSLSEITGSMKNMMGFAPPAHYQRGGWKKSAFHRRMHRSIVELNRYRSPDLTVTDATVGLADHHLGGAECKPRVNKILAAYDAREADRLAAGLLGLDWRSVAYLADDE